MTAEDSAASRIAELEADNRRLRRLLDQRDAPGELRHRLRSTVALLRAIIRKSAIKPRDLDGYADHIEGRLDAIARAQGEADERGAIELHKLIADELLQYGSREGEGLTLCGPAICLQPRAGQVMALAIHELAVNSIEHGALWSGGATEVRWTVNDEASPPHLTFVWREQVEPGLQPPKHHGFGSEVLTGMLSYELGASTQIQYGPDMLTCTIELPLTRQVGWLSDA